MKRKDEVESLNSCLTKALDDEMIFVLLARDLAAPVAIRAWIAERIRLGKNRPDDPEIVDARECAVAMEQTRDLVRIAIGKGAPR